MYLIGAGPGDPDLITVRGARLLQTCDAVVYDALVANELVASLPASSEKHYVGKRAGRHCFSQKEINKLLARLARKGKRVARLKGGDPFVFGRGAEEARHLKKSGVRFEVVSGVTSGVAALAYNGIPATDRAKSSFVVFATGHKASAKRRSSVPWDWVARSRKGTIVIYMGVGELEGIVRKLRRGGMPGKTPCAIIERGTFPSQRVITAPLSRMPTKARAKKVRPPALIVIGDVVGLRSQLRWYEERPLSGVRVMITRMAGQGRELRDSLRDLGAEVLSYPTVSISPCADPRGWRAFDRVRAPERWLAFTSENGVRHFFKAYLKRYGDVRRLAGFKIAAVGRATARTLSEFSVAADLVPAKATAGHLARRLKSRLKRGALVVRVRGNLAPSGLEGGLRAAGIGVAALTVYRTRYHAWPDGWKAKLFAHPPRVMIFASGSSVEGLFANLSDDEGKGLAAGAVVASIGPRTSEALRARGLQVAVEARKHTVPDLIGSIVRALA